MGHYEDFWWEITESIDKLGLKKEFDAQLNKMRSQDKHKYKDMNVRERIRTTAQILKNRKYKQDN